MDVKVHFCHIKHKFVPIFFDFLQPNYTHMTVLEMKGITVTGVLSIKLIKHTFSA